MQREAIHASAAQVQQPSIPSLRIKANHEPASSTDDQISPAILNRARASAVEHTRLSQSLAKSFDTTTAKRLGELAPINDALTSYDAAQSSLTELHTLLSDPDTDTELRTLASDDISTANATLLSTSTTLSHALIPRHPFADLPALLEIRPGIGGSEAALFAADLLRMYTAYSASHGLRATILKYEDASGGTTPGSDALQEAVLEFAAPGAYGLLRCEAGVHRVQRVPATESKGRTHTSAVSVLVLPSVVAGDGAVDETDPASDYYVNAADVRVDVMRARGAGGQHVNTTDSAVRLTHDPSGTVVNVQAERSQLKNRAKAWQILRARLAQSRREAREEEALKLRRGASGHGKSGRSDKIRTYNWGQQRVTDHRSGVTINQLGDVMEGGEGLETIMESARTWMKEREMEALVEAE